MHKLSISDRIKVLRTGTTKGIIPSLPDIDGWGDVPLATYNTKPEQLRSNIGWVYAANSAIVDKVAAVPLQLFRKKSDGDREEIHNHELLDLLNRPMLAHDGTMMRSLIHTYRNLVGESYLLMIKNGSPTEVKRGQLPDALQLLPAHLVDFKLGENRYTDSIVRYGQTKYKISEVIRGLVPNPGDPYSGRSIIAASSASIDIDQQMQSWNRRMFANNARPGLIFNLQGDNISTDSYERIKQQMQELYTSDGVFKSLVVENGEVKPYMLSHQDLDFLGSRAFTRDEILAMFKLPAAELGMTESFNRANVDGARYINALNNIVPRLRAEVAMWNSQLVNPYDPTLELDFTSPVPEDAAAKLNEASKGVNSWLTIDEVRDQYGLQALPDKQGEQLYVQFNQVPLSTIATPAIPITPIAAKSEGKKSLPKLRS
jgi:HK97 family phage portal protein